MKKSVSNMLTFEMVIENNNSVIIKKIYPESLSAEEIEQEEKDVPKVILHCFDPAKVLELQTWGEKIAKEHLEIHSQPKNNSLGIYDTLKSFLF